MYGRAKAVGTDIRPEISTKKKHHISKDRYYELLHFCRQYPEWKKELAELENFSYIQSPSKYGLVGQKWGCEVDPVGNLAAKKAEYKQKIQMVQDCAKEADPDLNDYILLAVTEGVTYSKMETMLDIPCERGMFYRRYRRFFWLLSQARK